MSSVAKRRAARLEKVRGGLSGVVEVRERLGARCVVLEEGTFEAPGACEELVDLLGQWEGLLGPATLPVPGARGLTRTWP